jgi:acetyltransferase EpsM
MVKRVIILGGIGNGSIIGAAMIDAKNAGSGEFTFTGYLNDREPAGSLISGMPVLGNLGDVPTFLKKGFYFINTIYRIDGQKERIRLFESLEIPEDRLAVFVHPKAYVAPSVKLMPGSVVMPNASINTDTIVGKCSLIMVNAFVGHDNMIGNYCHFAAQSCVGSYSNIGRGVHIGLNASTRENLTIGNNATLGIGSVLTKNMGDNEIWVGNPAKFLRMAQ